MKRDMKKRLWIIILLAVVLIVCVYLYNITGFLNAFNMDKRDEAYWDYEEGVIAGAKEFSIYGDNSTCWILVHGYTASPYVMKELAEKISDEFGETVVVPRLKGSAELPSHIIGESIDSWYDQIQAEYDTLHEDCDRINMVGSSLGAAISLKIAQNNDVAHVVALNPFFKIKRSFFIIPSPEFYLKLFGGMLKYAKKSKISNINSPEGLARHKAFWNMPFVPIRDSLKTIDEIRDNLGDITVPITIAHSKNDKTADMSGALILYEETESLVKKLRWFDDSNHILLMDYDKDKVIDYIIDSEEELRER